MLGSIVLVGGWSLVLRLLRRRRPRFRGQVVVLGGSVLAGVVAVVRGRRILWFERDWEVQK